MHSGYALYIALAVLLAWFWRRTRGASLDDLVQRSAREHHQVIRILERHPSGGNWREFRQWVRQDQREHPGD